MKFRDILALSGIVFLFVTGWIYYRTQVQPKQQLAELRTAVAEPANPAPKKYYPVSKWKPKENIKNNQAKWAGEGFQLILKNECNKCEKPCWVTKGDPGSLTCVGVALARNPQFYSKLLTQNFQQCKQAGLLLPDRSHPFGKRKDFCYMLRMFYWENYAKTFKNCSWSALINLMDSSVLAGPSTTIKIFQKSQGIKADGLWGPQSETACQKGLFNKQAFLEARIAHFKRLKHCDRFCEGWIKRAKQVAKN